MFVKQIKIDFNVTQEIKRFVYVYLIENENGCVLIDSGVAGSEMIIEKSIMESGHHPSEIKAIFLTHAHPDHIGTAYYFSKKYGAKIYASEGERAWIENIDLQFEQRPIPNFYNLAGKSVHVDYVVKHGEVISICDGIDVEVIATPGHSADEMSYRIENFVFIGDAVPVKGDIPIFIDLENTRNSLEIIEKMSGVVTFYPAWDKTYSPEIMRKKIIDARELIDELEETVCNEDEEIELHALVEQVCYSIHMPMWKTNPLFARTIACFRRK